MTCRIMVDAHLDYNNLELSKSRVTNMQDSMKTLFINHKGKVTDKWSSYLDEWDRIFEPYRNDPLNLLEIGIQNGGSLEVWAEALKSARNIVGCDINEKCRDLRYNDPRISVVVGDANSAEIQKEILRKAPAFEIIIDDGSHVSSDTITSFGRYFPNLTGNGIYIIEDLHTSYWQEFEGGLYYSFSAISFLKKLADIPNHEHWRAQTSRTAYLSEFDKNLASDLDENSLAQIHSVEFLNSMCIIRKKPKESNRLGERVIAGTDAIVENSVTLLKNTTAGETYNAQDEENPVGEDSLKMTFSEKDEMVWELENQIKRKNDEIGELRHAAIELQKEIDDYVSSTSWRITKPLRDISSLLKKKA